MKTLGLDEAGRGCVLGPLVIGGFLAPSSDADLLRSAGADDSKRLSHKRRIAAQAHLLRLGMPILRTITPSQIDAGNINHLEEAAFIDIIVTTRPDQVIIDAPCNPRAIPALTVRLADRLRAANCPVPTFIIQPKADATFPHCGAASIFAKVARDAAIRELGEVGSGYPSDPITRAWLSAFIERGEAFPDCVRTRWGTIDALRQQVLF